MRKHQIGKKIAAIAMAAAMAVSAAFSGGIGGTPVVHAAPDNNAPKIIDSASSVNYAAILGRATDFGILAEEFYQNNHMETTFAVNDFYNGSDIPNEVDFPLNDFTAQFLLGDVKAGYFHLGGKQTAKVYNVETSTSIANEFAYPWKDENNHDKYTGKKGKFDLDHDFHLNGKVFNVIGRSDVSSNISLMISDVDAKSKAINKKATNPDYAYVIPDSAYTDNSVKINLNYDNYKGKVVYINVDSKLADRFSRPNGDNGSGQGVHIIKDESTVVVFNWAENLSKVHDLKEDSTSANAETDGVKISKYGVSFDGGKSWLDTYTDSSMSEEKLKAIDSVNQTVIFNVVADGPVELNTSGGAILVPGTNNVNITGSSTGWLVSGGKAANNGAEWHYIYRGGNQEYSSDGEGEIHFSARKSITRQFNGENTLEDNTFDIEPNEYTFNWYETDESYNIDGVKPVQVKNQATSTVKFPILKFFSSDTVNTVSYTNKRRDENIGYNGVYETYSNDITNQINAQPRDLNLTIEYNGSSDSDNGIVIESKTKSWQDLSGSVSTKSGYNTVTLTADDILEILETDTIGNYLKVSANSGVTISNVKVNYPVVESTVTSRPLTDDERKYYVENGKTRDFYYYVNEENAGTINSKGVEISNGYIKIHLLVTNKDGKLSYAVNSQTVLGNGEVFFTNGSFDGSKEPVNMSSVEFGLLDFYNRVVNGFEIDKVAIAGGEEIAGATLIITSKDDYPFNKLLDNVKAARTDGSEVTLEYPAKYQKPFSISNYKAVSYTTEKGKHTIITGLPEGNYTLTEITTPGGYQTAESIDFSVDDKGVVTSASADGNVITMIDKIEVNVAKVDEYGETVTGATLQILDKDRKLVATITSDKVELEAGEYYLHEEQAPEGYKKAEDIHFVVNEDATIDVYDAAGKKATVSQVKMVDNHATDVYVKKADFKTGDELSGATMTLSGTDSNGAITFTTDNVELGKAASLITNLPSDKVQFISGDEDTLFKGLPDGNYELVEDVAPDGYKKITTTIAFKIEKGVVTSSDVTVTQNASDSKQVVTVVNNLIGKGNLVFVKTVTGGVTKEEANGALTFQVTKGTGTDKKYLTADGTLTSTETTLKVTDKCFTATTDKDGNVIYTATFNNIVEGEYTITEINKAIKTADGSNYTYTFVDDKSTTTADATVEEGKTITVSDLKDVYEKKTDAGNLEFIKTVTGGVTKEEADGALTFQVTKGTGADKKYLTADGTLTSTETTLKVTDKCFTATTDKDGNVIYTATFTGIEVGDYVITEKNTAIKAADGSNYTYTFVEDKSTTSGTAKVEKGKTATVSDLKDVYEKKTDAGNLEFIKTVTGGVTKEEADGALTFQVTKGTGTDKKYLTADGTLTSTETTLKVTDKCFTATTDKDGNVIYTATFTGIEVGDYVITEKNTAIKAADGSNYTYTFVEDKSTTSGTAKVEKGKTATVSDLKDVYEKKTDAGNLEFIKTVTGGVTKEEADGALTFQVTKGTGADKKYLTADGTLTSTETTLKVTDKCFTATTDKDGNVIYTATFTGIEVGDYVITEKNTAIKAADGSNYTYTFVEDKSTTSGTAKVEKGKTATVSDLKDVYEKKTDAGNLEFIKTVTGGVTKEEADGALTFQVTKGTGADKKYLTADGTLTSTETTLKVTDKCFTATTDKDGNVIYTATFTGIEVGDYVITEKNTAIKAADGSNYTYTFVEDKSTTSGTATVEIAKTATVELSDVYEKNYKVGSLEITKSFAKDCITEEEKEGGLQFTVTTDGGKLYLTSDGKLTETKTIYTLKPDFTYDASTNKWTKTFENVPVGTYTVEEVNTTIEGYKFKGSTFNGANGTKGEITVEADETATENIVNEYEKVASLTVKKAVTDSEAAAAASDKVYQIALMDEAGKYFNGTDFAESEKFYDIKTAAPVTFKNLPVGKKYTIVENLGEENAKVNITGFTFNEFTAEPVDLTADATITVTNDYTRDKGNLVITKLVKGPVTEEEFNGALTFKVVDEKGNPITVIKNDGTTGTSEKMTIKDYFKPVSSSNGEFKYELVIENVPTGKYTVTETNTTFDGYELVSKTGGGETNVVKGKDAITEFVDEYKQVTGSLEIVKNFKDAPSNLDASKLVFKVTGPKLFNDGKELTVTYKDFKDGKYVIKNAPIGTYTVTETSREESLIDGNFKYTFNAGASSITGSTTVIKDTKATVSLMNVYDKEEILGSLTINKTVAMNDNSEIPEDTFVADKEFKVSVQNTDTGLYVDANGKYSESPQWIGIKAGSPVVIDKIRLGNYTVSEDVADATRVDYRIIYVGSASVSEADAKLTTDARDGSVTLSNVYKHYEKEDIIDYPVFFSKEDSLSGAEIAGATIELYKGEKAEGTPITSWVSTLTSHVENLEVGTYTFKETVAPTGYDIVETAITFTVEKDDTVEKGYSVKLIDLSDEVCYQRQDGTLVLKDDPMLGILKVVKVITTDTGNKPEVEGFNVTVKNLKNNKYVQSVDGKLGDEAADIFVPIGADGVGSVEITGLRPARYLVVEKEDGKAVKGFIYDANGSIAELEQEITLNECTEKAKDAKPVEVKLVNEYVEDIGNLEITKTVTGDVPGKTEFKVTVKNADGKYVTADGKLSDEEVVLTVKTGETLAIKNVPSGKYTVAEDVTDAADVTGYKFNSEKSVSAKDATVTQGSTATVELTNDYTEVPTGHLYVHVTEEKSELDVPDATVTVTNDETGETFKFTTNDKGEIVDENGETPELPVGDYTVVVSDVPKGYDITTGESAKVTVPKNDTGRHEAVIKTVRGGIIITVYDEETGDVVPNAEVTITTPDGNTDSFITDADGQVKEYAKKDQFGNYTQIPGTFTYVVTKVPEGYKVTTGEYQTGVVEAEKLTELEARIAPKTGGLDIKVVDEKTGEPVEKATVEVVLPDGSKMELITDKEGMITKFAEKDATGKYTAKIGEYKITVTKVPEGYSVTTGQTKTETVVEGEVKHHIAKIATTKKSTVTDTTNKTDKTNTTKKTDTNAKTGDATAVAGILALMIMSLAGIGFIIRRKKEDEK